MNKLVNVMKYVRSYLMAGGLLLAMTLYSYAIADSTSGIPIKDKIVLQPKPKPNLRPKAPSMQEVSCTYSDGNLHFEFAFPEGQCQLILSDLVTGETVAAGFDSAASEPVYVGYHATASLTVTTANGNTYSGTW